MTPGIYERMRGFNRAILNPITKLFAGRFFYSLVYHMGRRSGSEYSTPVVATVRNGHIVIPLPYGTKTDWMLNVQAMGKCEIKIKGQLYQAVEPEIVAPAEALPVFPAFLRWAFERARVESYLRLKIE